MSLRRRCHGEFNCEMCVGASMAPSRDDVTPSYHVGQGRTFLNNLPTRNNQSIDKQVVQYHMPDAAHFVIPLFLLSPSSPRYPDTTHYVYPPPSCLVAQPRASDESGLFPRLCHSRGVSLPYRLKHVTSTPWESAYGQAAFS